MAVLRTGAAIWRIISGVTPILSIIIVSYNTKSLTAQTIESIFDSCLNDSSLCESIEIIVVDNASTDGSVEYLSQVYSDKIVLIANPTNAGFAAANNLGISHANGENFLLLNSDTIIQSGTLRRILDVLESDVAYGILSVKLLNPDGSYQPQGGALPTLPTLAAWWLWPLPGQLPGIASYQEERDLGEGKTIVQTGWVGGTAMILRKTTFTAIGGLDEAIFMYAEDVEYCLRASKSGIKVGVIPDCSIVHIGSASSSSDRARIGEIIGLRYLLEKHSSMHEALLFRGILVLGAVLRYLLFGILGGNIKARRMASEWIHVATAPSLQAVIHERQT